MFVNNLFFHDQGPTMSKNTKTKLACIIVDEKKPKCFSFNRNLFFYYLFFSSAYILSTRAVMVRRNDSVFSLYKGHEITEPLVIHKTQEAASPGHFTLPRRFGRGLARTAISSSYLKLSVKPRG